MITVRNLWSDQSWQMPADEDLWRFAQAELPEVMLGHPRTTDELIRGIRRQQNWDVVRQGHPEVDAAVVPEITAVMRAAELLAGDPTHAAPAWRAARVLHEDDLEAAALASCGAPVTEVNRRALRGLLAIRPVEKAEPDDAPPEGEVQAVQPEGRLAADVVARAMAQGMIRRPELKGHPRHSAGTWLARDAQSGRDLLLKPGAGQQPAVAGVREERAGQPVREVATWYALQGMGLGHVAPQADLITIGGVPYAAEAWLGDDWTPAADADPAVLVHEWRGMLTAGTAHILAGALFVLGDGDAHGHNVLVHQDHANLKTQLIDFGSALAGDGFDPGHDPLAFTPFVLRFWAQGDYGRLSPEGRLAKLPRISRPANASVWAWLASIRTHVLHDVLQRYGAMPGPTLRRLAALRQAIGRQGLDADEAIDRAWTVGLTTLVGGE